MAVSAIKHILCPVDFSDHSRRALDHAAAMALWYKAPLTVLHVFANLPMHLVPAAPVPHLPDNTQRETELRQFVEGLQLPPAIVLNLVIREGRDIGAEILAQVDALKVDLLVMGTHGRSGFKHLLLGSVAEAIVHASPRCPVIVVPPRAPDVAPGAPVHFSRILCPMDFSESATGAVTYAIDITQKAGAQLTLLHAIEVPPEFGENRMAPDFDVDRARAAAERRSMERLQALIPATVRNDRHIDIVVVEGAAPRELLRQATARNMDLIVMGAHSHGVVDRLVFGSTTQQVIREARCPVLVVVRSPGDSPTA